MILSLEAQVRGAEGRIASLASTGVSLYEGYLFLTSGVAKILAEKNTPFLRALSLIREVVSLC